MPPAVECSCSFKAVARVEPASGYQVYRLDSAWGNHAQDALEGAGCLSSLALMGRAILVRLGLSKTRLDKDVPHFPYYRYYHITPTDGSFDEPDVIIG
ncbi:hypothetical protein ACFLZ1_04275 [Patescibacteria group bacterium]